MLPVKMTAIEYNALVSLLKYITDTLPTHAADYLLSGISIDVKPSYPGNLTKFSRPSIIVQKVHTKIDSVGFGNVLGKVEDATGIYDVYGNIYSMTFQIRVPAKTNTQCLLITSIITEQILSSCIVVSNHLLEVPVEIGSMKLFGNIDITYLASNDNDDCDSIIDVEYVVVQSIIDTSSDMVDLSKGIKWNAIIKL